MGKKNKTYDNTKDMPEEQMINNRPPMFNNSYAPAKGPIRMQPIVQPIALVPYGADTQNVPPYGEFENYDDEYYDDYEEDSRRLNGLKLTTFIFGLLAIAVMILGKFITMDYFILSDNKSGLEIIMGITTVLSSNAEIMDKLPTILLTAGAVLLVLLVLISIFSIKRGTGTFSKIIAVLMALCLIGYTVLIIVNKTASYGGYIVGGLSLLIAIFTLVGKKRR